MYEMNKRLWWIAAVAVWLLTGGPCLAEDRSSTDNPIATVNESVISASALECETQQLAVEMRMRNRPISEQHLRQLRGLLIENLIEREILYLHARTKNINVRSQWIEASLSELEDQLGGSRALQTYLSNIGMTHSQLKDWLAKGLTVRQLLRKEPILAIKVSEAEKQAFYRQHPELFQSSEQIRVRHILIAVPNMNDETQRMRAWEKIQNLKTQLENGANFAVLALEYSDCPSRVRAGDLGYETRDQLIASFAEAAFELEPGMISHIVETRFGYHLIKMIDRRPSRLLSYKDVRDKIERTLRRNKENIAVNNYIAALKPQYNIKRLGQNR